VAGGYRPFGPSLLIDFLARPHLPFFGFFYAGLTSAASPKRFSWTSSNFPFARRRTRLRLARWGDLSSFPTPPHFSVGLLAFHLAANTCSETIFGLHLFGLFVFVLRNADHSGTFFFLPPNRAICPSPDPAFEPVGKVPFPPPNFFCLFHVVSGISSPSLINLVRTD